jgi:hypothetical protein
VSYVRNISDIEENAFALLDVALGDNGLRDAALKLIKGGRVFYPIQYRDALAFVPSKFIGYRHNTVPEHERVKRQEGRDGRDTNEAIRKILGLPSPNPEVEMRFVQYCSSVGVEPENHKRRFWRVEAAKRFVAPVGSAINDIVEPDAGNDDPEYRTRMAGTYVRDQAVRSKVLRRANGKCEFCGKDGFLTKSGTKFLETHHIISLSEQGRDKVDNVIALCPNDHRQAHFGADWKGLQDDFLSILRRLGR